MLACRVLGHRPAFRAEGEVMRWACERGCGAAGEKQYGSADAATRYAAALDRRGDRTLGRGAPLFGLFPLRIWHWWRTRRRDAGSGRGSAARGGEDAPSGGEAVP